MHRICLSQVFAVTLPPRSHAPAAERSSSFGIVVLLLTLVMCRPGGLAKGCFWVYAGICAAGEVVANGEADAHSIAKNP